MRAESRPLARSVQRGFFLIEAMVAILIFALGILGLVAMGGTAVSAQSDAQYRTEASSLADAIAAQIALGVTRNGDDVAKATSLAAFAHQATPVPPVAPPWPCTFTGTALTSTTAPSVFPLLQRAANLTSDPGLPGATAANQQIFIDSTPPNFNRVVITLCWKTAADGGAWRHHTLVTYVN